MLQGIFSPAIGSLLVFLELVVVIIAAIQGVKRNERLAEEKLKADPDASDYSLIGISEVGYGALIIVLFIPVMMLVSMSWFPAQELWAHMFTGVVFSIAVGIAGMKIGPDLGRIIVKPSDTVDAVKAQRRIEAAELRRAVTLWNKGEYSDIAAILEISKNDFTNESQMIAAIGSKLIETKDYSVLDPAFEVARLAVLKAKKSAPEDAAVYEAYEKVKFRWEKEYPGVDFVPNPKFKCPHCASSYIYRRNTIGEDRTVACQNCGEHFKVEE